LETGGEHVKTIPASPSSEKNNGIMGNKEYKFFKWPDPFEAQYSIIPFR
jgi:hypothetical protein